MDHFIVGGLMAFACLAAGAARAAGPPIEDYGKLPAVEQMSLSPSGEKLAWLAVTGDGRQLVIAKAGGEVLFTIRTGALRPRRVAWLGDGHVLIEASKTLAIDPNVSHSTQRVEATQSTIVDAATGAMKTVFFNDRLIHHSTFGYFGYGRTGGQEYGYFGGVTLGGGGTGLTDFEEGTGAFDHNHSDLYRVNLATGVSEKVGGGSERKETTWVMGPDGAVVGRGQYDIKGGEWILWSGQKLGGLIARERDPTGEISVVGLGRTPATVLVERPGDDGDWARIEYGPGGAKAQPFGDTPMREELRDSTTNLLIGGITNEDDPRTILFDPAQQAIFDKIRRAFPGERVALISSSAGLQRMVLHTDGPGDSGTYFLVDVPTKKISAIGWDYPTVLPPQVAPTRMVTYKAADGLTVRGILTLPPGREAKGLAAVVLPHGGPQGHDTLHFDWWAQALASRGYAVFQPNFRGSDGEGKAFRDAGFGQWGRKMQTDISDGVADLARQGVVDPQRVCIVGASYGGYAALAGVTLQQGLYRCAVAVSGVSDLNAMLAWEADRGGESTSTMRYWRRFMGTTSDGDGSLKALSPARLAAKADAPVLLIHGRDDTTVAISQSRNMRAALAGAGKAVELIELAGEDHYLSTQATRVQMLAAVTAFVEKNNPAK
ncbi:MAG: S9 family peptidase [Caulobacteraceae bacterium]|nr:S9 family peptidase [Caulobacteraceae bacterium]